MKLISLLSVIIAATAVAAAPAVAAGTREVETARRLHDLRHLRSREKRPSGSISEHQKKKKKKKKKINKKKNRQRSTNLLGPPSLSPFLTMPSGVKIQDLKVGNGKEARNGDIVDVHYIGTLPSGQEFDNSYRRGTSFSFPLGAGRVIKAWDEALVGMKEGGKRLIVAPPDTAYGSRGGFVIPPGATLTFVVEMQRVSPRRKRNLVQRNQKQAGAWYKSKHAVEAAMRAAENEVPRRT